MTIRVSTVCWLGGMLNNDPGDDVIGDIRKGMYSIAKYGQRSG